MPASLTSTLATPSPTAARRRIAGKRRWSWLAPTSAGACASVRRSGTSVPGPCEGVDIRTEQELVSAAHRNFLTSYRKLVEHCEEGEVREAGDQFAFVTGLPLSLFNGCIVVGPTPSTDVDAALDWLASRGLPHRVWIDELRVVDLADVPLAHGFTRDEQLYPGMVLHPIPDAPEPPPDVSIEAVTPSGLEEFLSVSIESGMPPEPARRLFSPTFAADPDVRLFIGRLEDRPVGTSVAIRGGDVSGVYAVGTRPAARRRGVGTALTWAAVDAGRAWGCDTIVLQASMMGLPIYEAMGFRTVVMYAQFGRVPPARDERLGP